MNVLIACEESQRVCIAFREHGYNAFSCDIQQPSGGHPEWHFLDDVHYILFGGNLLTMDYKLHYIDKWDLIIAHPPCTYLSKAGACRLYPQKGILNRERYIRGLFAKQFFESLYYADCKHIAIENPIPLKIFELPKYDQIIQPYEYGHPYSKKTCLWLKGLPPLVPTNILIEYKPFLPSFTSRHKGNKEKNGIAHTAKERAKTFSGIAAAMAEQWGDYVYDKLQQDKTRF